MDQEKLKELLKDENFAKELFSQDNPEDVQKLLEEKGVEISTADIRQIAEILKKVSSGEISQEQLEKAANGELSEDELEDVAGGILPFLIPIAILWGATGAGLIGGAAGITHEATSRRW